jgi:hypothetical protein
MSGDKINTIQVDISIEDVKDIAIEISENCNRVKRCITEDDYLCSVLNSIDHKILKDYYNSNNSGPVVEIRKKICEELLLRNINTDKLNEIIKESKSKNPSAFRSWTNNFNILNSILINEFNPNIGVFLQFLIDRFDRKVKSKVWDFRGARNQGQDHYCILLYNEEQESHSSSLQFIIDFASNSQIKYGIWREIDKSYINGPFYIESESFEQIIDYIESCKRIILDDVLETEFDKMTFTDAAKFILQEFGNKPMTSREIWDEINKRNLVKTKGKTPWASINTIILNDCLDSPVNGSKSRDIFKIVDSNPAKFILNNYMPKNIKETLIQNGFITIDMLKDIFEKNGLKFNE